MPNDFTPLTHEELRELWKLYACDTEFIASVRARKLILSAVWWEAMENKAHRCSFGEATHERSELCCLPPVQARFLAKLREIGIDWRGRWLKPIGRRR